ncbi:MAG: Lin0512 family protein [candidate division NC10 bacterium]|nr:Lin0512 family protein [candidate division NC10 bacterium]
MGVDVHGRDSTKAACRAVADAIRHSRRPRILARRSRSATLRAWRISSASAARRSSWSSAATCWRRTSSCRS